MNSAVQLERFFLKGRRLRRLLFMSIAPLSFYVFALLSFTSTAYATTQVSGTISQNTTWNTAGSPYVLTGNVTVSSGVTLTVQQDVVVKPQYTSTSLTINGSLIATGVIFTSFQDDSHGGDTNGDGNATSPQPGDWGNISISSTATASSLNACTISYGGSAYNEVSIGGSAAHGISNSVISKSKNQGLSLSDSAVSISGSSFADNGGDGLNASAASLANLYSNTFTGNNGNAVIMSTISGPNVYGNTYSGNKINGMFLTGDVAQNTTWPASNSPYVIQGVHGGQIGNKWLQINSGVTLTVEPDAVVKFYMRAPTVSHNTDNELWAFGGLIANGAVFTSFNDDSYGGDTNGDGSATSPQPGDWNTIDLSSTANSSTFSGCVVRYGGSYAGAELQSFASSGNLVTITGSAISYSKTAGINIGNPNFPSIHFNDIFANTTYGIGSTVALDASNNYWGSKHGPQPYGSGNGFITYNNASITVTPWSRVPFTQAGAAYQATLGMDDYCAMCGDPINTATGAFVYQHEDIKIATRGLPLEFQRT
ncbi:MAG: right-handed parallel beta-helix repeat-containing protein, partial [Thermoleophilia bacterium]